MASEDDAEAAGDAAIDVEAVGDAAVDAEADTDSSSDLKTSDDTKPEGGQIALGEQLRNLSRVNQAALLAHIVLLFGYTINLWFQYYEFNDRDMENLAMFLYFLAFALLISSAVIELGVDVFSKREVGHGRYHADSATWNRIISILFIFAGILDIVAFFYWINMDMTAENLALLVGAYVLLVMAMLALCFQLMTLKSQAWADVIRSDRIDFMANILILVITVMNTVLRHVEHAAGNPMGDSGPAASNLEMAIVVLFLLSSVLYVTADVLKLKDGVMV